MIVLNGAAGLSDALAQALSQGVAGLATRPQPAVRGGHGLVGEWARVCAHGGRARHVVQWHVVERDDARQRPASRTRSH